MTTSTLATSPLVRHMSNPPESAVPVATTTREIALRWNDRSDCNTAAGAVTWRSVGMTKYDHVMTVERLTVSLESELALAVREAAEADEQNVSAWLADAARRRLATRGLRDVIAAWEREHGAFSDEELAAARALVDG